MSYFDHVRCTACKAMLDPEHLATIPGQGMSCPRCRAPLSVSDLFGLKDAFVEEESPDLSLDDLVSGFGDGAPAGAPPSAAPQPRRPARSAAPRGSTSLVRRDASEEEEAPSALEAMRSLRRK